MFLSLMLIENDKNKTRPYFSGIRVSELKKIVNCIKSNHHHRNHSKVACSTHTTNLSLTKLQTVELQLAKKLPFAAEAKHMTN